MVDLLDLGLPDEVERLLAEADIAPERLELEITESVIMADPLRVGAVLERLREVGVALAIDDFGTGYSSLAYLKNLPVDVLKIDRSFVSAMASRTATARSCTRRSTSRTASAWASSPRAIEDEATYEALRRIGCDVAQGYYISRPVPAEEIDRRQRGLGQRCARSFHLERLGLARAALRARRQGRRAQEGATLRGPLPQGARASCPARGRPRGARGQGADPQGDTGREFFVLMDGEVEVVRDGELLGTSGAGDFIGEISILEDMPRTATVTAKTPVRLFVLTAQSFRSFVEDAPEVENKVLRTLARRLAAMSDDPAVS